ncbi:MAG: hypothetical protein ATN31_05225 [Candidatus Epulonipiscioides saccharophilum]|nr:MAG: hypothetical protein ATN31_05225 [Epulopiscium sp. AS2M-Bin001]
MAQIFWGYLVILLSFKINSIELLPEFLGYFFIMKGAIFLSNKVNKFADVKTWAAGLSIIHLVLFVNSLFIGFYLGSTISYTVSVLLQGAFFYVTYLIIIAMKDLELSIGQTLCIDRLLPYFKIMIAVYVTLEFTNEALVRIFSSFVILPMLVLILIVAKFLYIMLFIITLYKANVIYESYIKSL